MSDWLTLSQDRIDAFGAVTLDPDPMHVDPAWSRENSPFGSTIAFGFQTLSMLTHFSHQILGWTADLNAADEGYVLNYGFDRVRFIEPVRANSQIRCRLTLIGLDERGPGRLLQRLRAQVEVEGVARPALMADWLGLWITSVKAAA